MHQELRSTCAGPSTGGWNDLQPCKRACQQVADNNYLSADDFLAAAIWRQRAGRAQCRGNNKIATRPAQVSDGTINFNERQGPQAAH